MKTLTVSWLVCAIMVLTRATAIPRPEEEPGTDGLQVHAEYDSWGQDSSAIPRPEDQPGTDGDDLGAHAEYDSWGQDLSDIPRPEDQPGTNGDDRAGSYHHHLPSCPHGWMMGRFRMHCLLYIPDSMTRTQAMDNCKSKGGLLAPGHDTSEIHDLMQKSGHDSSRVWVKDCRDSDHPGYWWSFMNWMSGGSSSGDSCAQVSFGGNGTECLTVDQCDAQLPSVCASLLY